MRTRLVGFGRQLTWTVGLLGLIMTPGHGARRRRGVAAGSPGPILPRSRPGRLCRVRRDRRPSRSLGEDRGASAPDRDDDRGDAQRSAARLLDMALAQQPGTSVGGRDLVALGEHLLRSGYAVGSMAGARSRRAASPWSSAARHGEGPAIIDRLLRVGEHPRAAIKPAKKPGGRWVNVLGNPGRGGKVWWSEGDDLVVSLVAPNGVTRSSRPSTAASPTRWHIPPVPPCPRRRARLRAGRPGVLRDGRFPPLPRQAAATGPTRSSGSTTDGASTARRSNTWSAWWHRPLGPGYRPCSTSPRSIRGTCPRCPAGWTGSRSSRSTPLGLTTGLSRRWGSSMGPRTCSGRRWTRRPA